MARRSKRREGGWRMPNPKVVARMDAAALCGLLRRVGARRVPDELRAAIIARGPEAVEPLVELGCGGGGWWDDDGEGQWLSRNALLLLKEVGDARAVEPLLELLLELLDEYLFWGVLDGALQALEGIGAPALEPVMEVLDSGEFPRHRDLLIGVLSGLGVRDERIWALLVEQLGRDPEQAAGNLADYGDPAALPLLHAALARAPLRRPEGLQGHQENRVFIEVLESIEELGGELGPEERARAALLDSFYPQRRRVLD